MMPIPTPAPPMKRYFMSYSDVREVETGHMLSSREIVERLNAQEALLLQRAQEIAELQKQLLWRVGDADAFAEHLRDFLTWMECDFHENGPGPSGGFVSRRDKAAWALERGLALLAQLTARAQEIEQVKAEYVRMVQLHTDEEVDKYRWMQRAEAAEAALVSRAPQPKP